MPSAYVQNCTNMEREVLICGREVYGLQYRSTAPGTVREGNLGTLLYRSIYLHRGYLLLLRVFAC